MLSTLVGFTRKEIIETFRDKRMRMVMVYLPLSQLLIYGTALSSYTQNVHLAVVSRDDDAFMRRLERRFYASGWFVPADVPAGQDPADWIASRKAEAVLVADPRGVELGVRRGDGAMHLLIDSVNAVRARSIESYARSILEQALAEERLARSDPALRFSVRTFYNPERDTAIYLIPGTICMLLFVAITGLTNMSMSRERERGTIETLFASPLGPWELMLGKGVPFVVIGMLQLPFGLLFARMVGVPIRAPMWMILAAAFVFLCAAVAVGMLVASEVRNQQQGVFATFFTIFPIIQLSGVIFPVDNMPPAVAWLAYLNPLYYFVEVMRHLMLKGGDWGVIAPKMLAVVALGSAAAIKVAASFRTRTS